MACFAHVTILVWPNISQRVLLSRIYLFYGKTVDRLLMVGLTRLEDDRGK